MLILITIAVRLGGHLVLDHASASLPPKSRVGLVGRNGADNSTLLKIAAGVGNADDGAAETPRGTWIDHVAQETPGAAATPFETVLAADARRSRLLVEADQATDSLRIEIRNRHDLVHANGAPGRAARSRVLRTAASQAEAEMKRQSDEDGWLQAGRTSDSQRGANEGSEAFSRRRLCRRQTSEARMAHKAASGGQHHA
ncbi:MAG: hypothetical protein WD470_08615 [Rhodospirillaceae bacterium]